MSLKNCEYPVETETAPKDITSVFTVGLSTGTSTVLSSGVICEKVSTGGMMKVYIASRVDFQRTTCVSWITKNGVLVFGSRITHDNIQNIGFFTRCSIVETAVGDVIKIHVSGGSPQLLRGTATMYMM
jgi:hypothetical protein